MVQTLAPIAALLVAIAFVLLGHGLQSTLLPLAANVAGFSDTAIGVLSSTYYIGFVAGCLLAPYTIMRAGHIRAFAALVSLMSAAAIVHPIVIDPIAWSLIRFVSGFTLAGFYLIVESWLNENATNANRGKVLSIYIVILYLSMTVGQLSLTVFDIATFVPFAVASVVVSIAVVPVTMTRSNQPAPITLVRFRPIKLYRTSPAAVVGTFLIGMGNAAIWMLSPLYATRMGLDTNAAAYYAAAIVFGGALAQWPIGRISDRLDRRIVLVALGVSATIGGLVVLLLAPSDPVPAIAMAFVMGVTMQPAYAIAAAHAYDHADPDSYVETSSGLLLANGMGSIIGPFAAAVLMESGSPNNLYLFIVVVQIVLAAFVASRLLVRSGPTGEIKGEFEYASTAPLGAMVTPEPLDVAHPLVIPPEDFPAYERQSETAEQPGEPTEAAESRQASAVNETS